MRFRVRSHLAVLAASALTVAGLSFATSAPALASQGSTPGPAATLPNAVPSAITPAVDDGRVFGIAQVGSKMVIGGSFTSVGGQTRNRIAAFDTTTGALSSFAPSFNGDVNAVLPGPTSTTVYVGGAFTQVGGVAAKFVVLLDLNTGAVVNTFKPPTFNFGLINDMVKRGNRLYVAGQFTVVGGKPHGGLASLNATTGALDPFVNVQLTGHHNDTGSGAQGAVGPWDLDATPNGDKLVATGNFKYADGLLRDQIVMVDLSGASAQVATNWSTSRYSPQCFNWAFDGYIRGISFSPDGSYFVVNATGGGVTNTLCDATTRFETNATGTDVQPTWVNESGGDTLWGVTVTNTAVYVGGHNRWSNNPYGSDAAQPGAVPRPGLAALDPVSGRPTLWNPGRRPLGVAVFAMLATPQGLWIGSNNDYIGNRKYKRPKLAFFPYAGGATIASTATGTLPGTVYVGGGQAGTDSLAAVAFDGSNASSAAADNQGIDFGNWRGAFMVGNKVFYGYTDSYLYSRTFNGTTYGPATKIDPYNDPLWSDVDNDLGGTFRGMVPSLYGQMPNVTSMFYNSGKLYYTLSGDATLRWRWFSPDSGIMDERTANVSSSVDFSSADGMFVDRGSLYFASGTDGKLRRVAFADGVVSGGATVVSGPAEDGVNWTNRALFLYGGPAAPPPNQNPTAKFTSSCTELSCSFDASTSTDSDGTVDSYAWNFGDGTTGTGKTTSHSYGGAATYPVTLTVKDDDNASGSVSHDVTTTAPAPSSLGYVGSAHGQNGNRTNQTLTVPSVAHSGDTMLLFLTRATPATWSGPTGVTGWTEIATYANGSLTTTAWRKTVAATDPGATVRVDATAYTHASFNLSVYSGVDAASPIAAVTQSGDAAKTAHVTPTVTAGSGDWVVSLWGERSSTTTSWTAPSGVQARDVTTDTGTLRISALVADSGGPVAAGTYGGLTATTDGSSERANMFTIALNAAS